MRYAKYFTRPLLYAFSVLALCGQARAESATIAPGPSSAPTPMPSLTPAAEVRVVRLLTIGNSFATDATAYLADMAKAAGREAVIFRANPGGRSLEQHVKYMTAYETDQNDPTGRPYAWKNPEGKSVKWSLREALTSQAWDYVTIQQFSALSHQEASYEPYTGTLLNYIHKYAPTARVLLHQTWSYRADHAMFQRKTGAVPDPAQVILNQESMYRGLKQAYTNVAARYKLDLIPVGDAFHTAGVMERWASITPDPNFDFKNPPAGALPVEPKSLYLGWYWKTDKKTGKTTFTLDAKHANKSGRYLGACVFYNTLFKTEPPTVAEYLPAGVPAEDAEILRGIAIQTVKDHALAMAATNTASATVPTAQK